MRTSDNEKIRRELSSSQLPSKNNLADTVKGTFLQDRSTLLSSKLDTLTASIIHRSRISSTQSQDFDRSDSLVYTIQIGAFLDASNAMRLAKRAKEQFIEQLVLNTFEIDDKLYRVSIGLFATREEAQAFKLLHRVRFSHEYKDSWITQTTQ